MSGRLRFDGRVAIVTGAARGLGRAHAVMLADRGAAVVVNDLGVPVTGGESHAELAHDLAAEIRHSGGSAVGNSSDISTPTGAEALIEAALETFGRVDIIVNNAGIIRWSSFPEADAGELADHLAVHVAGTFNVTRAAWPYLSDQRYGRVVLTTSSAVYGYGNLISYGAAKGGVIGLARSLAVAGAESAIRVNVISPIAFTRMMLSSGRLDDKAARAEAARSKPEEVSAVVVALAHESCDVTGEIYVAGRGRAARMILAETAGYLAESLTPEDVLDNWKAINALDRYFVPADASDQGRHRDRLMGVSAVARSGPSSDDAGPAK